MGMNKTSGMTRCPKCNSTPLMDHLAVLGHGAGLQIRALADPGALIFTEPVTSKLEATVCGGCGFTELFALDPRALVEAVKAAEERRRP